MLLKIDNFDDRKGTLLTQVYLMLFRY